MVMAVVSFSRSSARLQKLCIAYPEKRRHRNVLWDKGNLAEAV